MNWKVWTWARQIGDLRAEVERRKEEKRRTAAEHLHEVHELQAQVEALSERLELIRGRTRGARSGEEQKRRDVERLTILAGVREEEPLWRVVLSYVDEHEENEKRVALAPGLNDGQRQFNAGRLASACDLACGLRDLRLEAEGLVKKAVGK